MCRATSEAQDRVIEKASEEMTMMVYAEPFLTAEIEYRRQRAAEQYGRASSKSTGKHTGGRRHWVPRRPSLKLPQARPRPLSVA